MIGLAAGTLAVVLVAGLLGIERATRPSVRPSEVRAALAPVDVRLHLAAASLVLALSWGVLGGVVAAAMARVLEHSAAEVDAGRCP